MKDHLLTLAAGISDAGRRLNMVREYLQAHALRSIQLADGFASLAFQGGTALRFIYSLRRYSEDLDFALERPERGYNFLTLMERIERDFLVAGYSAEFTAKIEQTVHRGSLKFPGLLHECRLSDLRAQKLSIRVEVDSMPPAGAVLETRLVTRHFPVMFLAHDLSSCMAGKVLAILTRGHTKGRDLYDLGWYLTNPDHPTPNIDLLRNGLQQATWRGQIPNEETWGVLLLDHLRTIDWGTAEEDVSPFLEDSMDRILLDKDLILSELEKRLK
ncbi:nucleotidyl transferase AbiEii/AbiGii toxin family protein [Gemmatimonadota bacterium]